METASRAEASSSDGRTHQLDLSWLTVEVAGYVGLVLLALTARLLLLDLWPLSQDELPAALSALRAARGEAWRAASYSPLLFALDLLLFALTKATDGAARLVSALAGTAIVATPYLFRRRLGRWGALAAAALAAVSPLGLYLSRSGDGTVLALLFVVLVLASLEHGRPGLLVVSLALGVLTTPGFYTLPIGIAIAVLIMRLVGRSHPTVARLREVLRGVSRSHLVWGGVVLALGATAATANLAGVGATAELAWRWVTGLVPSADAPAWWWTAASLAFYEPVTLVLAVAAAVY
ncbi:MAG: glycosyltransferase family 39 protein, partial [Anaerolineae bacterium]